MENDIHLCQKCGKVIPMETPYFSIVRSLEFLTENPDTEDIEIETEESEEIISLCQSCGSVFNKDALETILAHLPIPGQESRN